MEQKVSIIIPCYNSSDYIDVGIQSIYEQDYSSIELIVVNDGSSDDSEEKIFAWKNKFKDKKYSLKYIYQKNQGQAKAVETALSHVTGTYLTLLDADDYFLPSSIRKRAQFLDEHSHYAGVRSNGWLKRENNQELFIKTEKEKAIIDLFSALILGETNNWAGTYMIRTDLLFDAYAERKIYTSRFGQNLQILLPVAYKRKFGYIDEPLMVYVLHENSHSQACSLEEQFQKDENNAKGYRDIYVHMINFIVKDPLEHQKYMNAFDASYHRCAMLRAIKYNKKEHLEQHYEQLCLTGLITIDDKIAYNAFKKTIKAVIFRGIRKCKNFINNHR